jgi:class 3 adenylate cyclase/tetratricopeptide (TPR) repeat protein
MAASSTAPRANLSTFVPRLTAEWLRDDPGRLWQEVEGTLAFVDISGFTAMSERLSRAGKAGAEEVTDVMNATFAALLDVAYAEGGGLLKFGGDALLLLYSGEDHARCASRAAYRMRRVLRAVGRPRTSAGAVHLRMHAGIHSGQFHFFLLGESHRELLITGPGATRTVEMEAASEAGEIVLSPETAAVLPAAAVGKEKGPGLLLQGDPEGTATPAPLPEVADELIERALPVAIRAQLLEGGPLEGEHRNAALAFIRFSGVDEVLQSEGPDAVADALEALVNAIESAAADHGVTFLESDVDRDGGRIILAAGAPQTFGDDEERLLRTLRSALESGLPFPVHIGASRGRVFAGQVGAPFRRTYTVLGDTAALAARLMARAGEDEIYVAAEAHERGGAKFATTELEPFAVKGKSEPVRAVILGDLVDASAAAVPDQAEREVVPFVDRERERAVLAAALAPVQAGFGSLVELVGEPGIGKSRLAEELQDRCSGMRMLHARCDQYESTTPYHPFRPLLLSLLDVELNGGGAHNREVLAARLAGIDEELVSWAPLFAAPLDVDVESTPEVDDLDPAFWRARFHGVMGKLFSCLLDSPTLLLFEDVHWMDDASSELLRFLGTELAGQPWLACTTRRPVDGGFAAAEGNPPLPALSLRLEPLPMDDAKTLIRAAAGRSLSDDELSAITERGAGNPLFLQELASPEAAAEGVEELPETVEALVATRIDRLAPSDRTLLRWASVLGVSFSGALIVEVLADVREVAAASEAWDRLGEFVEHDTEVPGGLRFRHALIRDAAYEGLSFRRRRELHGRVAEVIERRQGDRPQDESELLSLHYYRAELPDKAWQYSVEAGRRAHEKYANVEAEQFFERALEVAKRSGEVADEDVAAVWEALGDVRMRLGRYKEAGAAFNASRSTFAPGPVEEARLIQKEAIVPLRVGRYPQALRRLSQALRTLEDVDGDDAAAQRARLFGWYASVLHHQKRPRVALEWCHRAIDEAERSGAQDALAEAGVVLDWAYVTLGRPQEAVYSQQAIEIYEELGDLDGLARVLNNLGGYAYLEGRWDDALELAERAREACRKIGDETQATFAALNIAEVRSDQGRFEEAEPALRELLELRRRTGIPLEIAEAASIVGRFAARVGSFDEAHSLLEEARELYAADGDEVDLLTTDARLIECLVLEQRADDAMTLAARVLERSEGTAGFSVLDATLHRLRGWAFMQVGDLDAAEQALDESLRLARLEGENFGIRSGDYEVALTLGAVARLRMLRGQSAAEAEAERDAIFSRLGVVAVVEPPLPDVAGSGG